MSPRVMISPLHLATISSTTAKSADQRALDPSTRKGTTNLIHTIMNDWAIGIAASADKLRTGKDLRTHGDAHQLAGSDRRRAGAGRSDQSLSRDVHGATVG